MDFEKAALNPNHESDIPLAENDIAADHSQAFESPEESPIREVDMNMFAEKPVAPEEKFELTSDGGYAQVTEHVQDLGDGLQISEPVEQIVPQNNQPDRVTDNTKTAESPQGVDSQILFDGNDTETLGRVESYQDLGDGVQIMGEGFDLNTNQNPEAATPGIEVQTGSAGSNTTESFNNKMPPPLSRFTAEELKYAQPGNGETPLPEYAPEQTPGSPEGMFFNREQLQTMIAERLGMVNNMATEGMNELSRASQIYIRNIAANPEMAQMILTASPEILSQLRGVQEKGPGKWSERIKKSREKSRGLLKRIIGLPGKGKDALVGAVKASYEGVKNLGFTTFVEKPAGLLNMLTAGRAKGRTKYFEAAEARKGELSPKQQEKLAQAKSKNATASEISDLIFNKKS